MDIKTVLATLDPANDEHWTNNGSPRMDVIQKLMNDDSISRKMVTDANPSFTRETATQEPVDAQEAKAENDDPAVQEAKPQEEEVQKEVTGIDFENLTLEIMKEIFSDEEALIAFQNEAVVKVNEWNRSKKLLENRVINLSRLSEQATNQLNRIKRHKTTGSDQTITNYLAQQSKVREEKALRAKAFIDQGIDANVLIGQLSGKSRLDQAMNQRKPARGSTRPDPRMPVRGARTA